MIPFEISLLLNARFQFGKTAPKNPHFYTLRKEWNNDDRFDRVVRYIREHGRKERFFGTEYTCLYVNEEKYWSMGAPVAETTLINKTSVYQNPSTHFYDKLASQYDSVFPEQVYREEERFFIKAMDLAGAVLDVGCGTGMLLDHVSPAYYVGVDPSLGMLNECRKKHPPSHIRKTIYCGIEDFYDTLKYDRILCLFGVASYIDPGRLEKKVTSLMRGSAKFYLSYYLDGYTAKTHSHVVPPKFYTRPAEDGVVFNGKYVVVTNDYDFEKKLTKFP